MSFFQNSSGGSGSANFSFGHNAWVDGIVSLSVFCRGQMISLTTPDTQMAVVKRTGTAANTGLFKSSFGNDGVGTNNNWEFASYNWTSTVGTWFWDGPQDTGWHAHLVTYSYSSTSNLPIYYLDGIAQTIVSTVSSPAGSIGSDNSPLCVGGTTSSTTKSWGGALRDAALWNTILTPLEAVLLASGLPPPLIRPDALVFYCPCSPDPAQAVDLGFAQLGMAAVTGTWLPADDPYGLLLPSRGEAPVAFSPAFQSFPQHRPNMPLLRR